MLAIVWSPYSCNCSVLWFLLGGWRSALWRGDYSEPVLSQVLDALRRIQTERTEIHLEHDLWAGSEGAAWQVTWRVLLGMLGDTVLNKVWSRFNKYIFCYQNCWIKLSVVINVLVKTLLLMVESRWIKSASWPSTILFLLYLFHDSYKLWYNYLRERRKQVKGKCITDPCYEEVNNCHERALVFMHKVKPLWSTIFNEIFEQNTVPRLFWKVCMKLILSFCTN